MLLFIMLYPPKRYKVIASMACLPVSVKKTDAINRCDQGKRIRLFLFIFPQNKGAVQPELNRFALQMASQPLCFALFICSA